MNSGANFSRVTKAHVLSKNDLELENFSSAFLGTMATLTRVILDECSMDKEERSLLTLRRIILTKYNLKNVSCQKVYVYCARYWWNEDLL